MNAILKQHTHRWIKVMFVQALVAMLWSLYYQFYWDPVVNILSWVMFPATWWFNPCVLCRWARVLMYPIVWLTWIARYKKDKNIVDYIFPMSVAWILLEVYHYLLQKTSWLDAIWWWTFCTKANPCAASQSVDYFGFMTIPFLCLVAFIVIFVACIIVKRTRKKAMPLHHTNI